MGDQIGSLPAEELLHARAEQAPTCRCHSYQPHRAIFALECQVSDGEERDRDQHGTAAKGGDVLGRFVHNLSIGEDVELVCEASCRAGCCGIRCSAGV